jgi:hypothetical protein
VSRGLPDRKSDRLKDFQRARGRAGALDLSKGVSSRIIDSVYLAFAIVVDFGEVCGVQFSIKQ